MKSFSDLLHRLPWWGLILAGVGVILALGVFVTPFHLIEYRAATDKEGTTAEERKAIRREVDNTFAEGALDLARSALLVLRDTTAEPARRKELDLALGELESARQEIREAGREARQDRREAATAARDAAREAASAIEEARRDADRAFKDAGVDNERVRQALDQSLKAAREAEEEAKKAGERTPSEKEAVEKRKRIVIGLGADKGRPMLDIDVTDPATGQKSRVEIHAPGEKGAKGGAVVIDVDKDAPPSPPKAPAVPGAPPPPAAEAAPAAPAAVPPPPPLPPEVRARIRENVSGDIRRIGIGAALVLFFVPLFILAIITKFFVDRSRAAQRVADLKRKEAEYHRLSRQVTEAKLQALQAQVEPHFLYNTLANVQALTEVDPAQAHVMVGHLIQYLRNALPKMRESVSTVGQEIELVRAYLAILKMRMGDRLAFDITVPESLAATPFPPLMLPSLVENAIKHGLEPRREGGSVHISAQAQDGRLRLVVADTGRGFGETVGAGVGLANIRERLAALYGDAAKLTLESNLPSGVIATLEVPLGGVPAAAAPGEAGGPGGTPDDAQAAAPKSAARKVLSAVGTAERGWRKGLSFVFIAAVVIAAVVSGLGLVAVMTGMLPVQVGAESFSGPGGALLGAAGIAIAFSALVVVLAVVAAILYGLGWLFAGLAIFIPVVVLIATLPATAPFILLGLAIWWLVRRRKRDTAPAPRVEPAMAAAPPDTAPAGATPPPLPPEAFPPGAGGPPKAG